MSPIAQRRPTPKLVITERMETVTTVTRSEQWQRNTMFLALAVGLAMWIASSGISLALQKKDSAYNTCACACDGPTGGGIIDISNAGGFACGAYNNRTCNYEDPATGGVRTGTTKYCTGFKPDGTKTMMLPRTGSNTGVMGRGVKSESPTVEGDNAPASPASEVQERAVPRMRLGNTSMNCSCDKGSGTCSVTSTDGKTSTCQKGQNDTCTGTCMYPKGTISGLSGAPMMR